MKQAVRAQPTQRGMSAGRVGVLARAAAGPSGGSGAAAAPPTTARRRSALGLLAGAALAATLAPALPAAAERPVVNKEVDAAESPFIQELLRRTEEKREERRKERLDAYNKKVFREYFEFDAGTEGAARARGLSPETAAAVRKWLDENADESMPGLKKRD